MKVILVADDDKHIRALYEETLKIEGYKVILAENGEQTLEIIKNIKIDLVILDVRMPGINGMETLTEINKNKSHPPVLVNTAYSGYIEDSRSWIAEGYIVKSSNTRELLKKIKEVLKKYDKESKRGH